jgi:hypothetical protein
LEKAAVRSRRQALTRDYAVISTVQLRARREVQVIARRPQCATRCYRVRPDVMTRRLGRNFFRPVLAYCSALRVQLRNAADENRVRSGREHTGRFARVKASFAALTAPSSRS